MVCGAAGLCIGRRDAPGAVPALARGRQDPAVQPQAIFLVRILRAPGLSGALQPAYAQADPATESRLMATRKLIVDGKEIEADDSITLLQACEQAGAEIPRFCYHERLSV